MKKTVLERMTSFVSPSLTDQRATLAARHEKTKSSHAELRSRCDELAVAGGADFEAACAALAAMEAKLAAEANALKKLDAEIAEAEAAAAQAKLQADRARAADHCNAV